MQSDDDRAVRVFISSTFIDMQGERDALVRKTFPALRARFRARSVELLEVDLRWGVTQEDLESGRTLPICLAEVDRCRPYFIGLLAERYGSLLAEDKVTPDLKEVFPVLREGVGRSLTEIEIIHGVLRDPAAAKRAYLFERDPAWLDELSTDERARYVADTDDARAKLADLKVRIRASGAAVIPYRRPADIGAAVESALGAALDARFPPEDAPDAFTQTLRLHAAFARERRELHIGAATYLAALDHWSAQADAKPMLITGASGGGKSTLVANWLRHHRATVPQDIVFEHYLGASPDSADPMLLIRRLWEQLNRATGEMVEAPSDDLALIDGLSARLAQASVFAERQSGQILIALDGLDKLSSKADLSWLPSFLPARVKLLASSLEGVARSAAEARGWDKLEVEPLTQAERRLFVAGTLEAWGRKLSPERTERVLGHSLAGRPLFLKTVLDELRYSGTEARLDARLEFYLAARDLPDLFARVLERFEGDCGVELVRAATSLIWASRAGLEEAEIIAIAGSTPLAWATLRNGLADALRDQDGRVTFSHDYLRQAVGERYLPTQEAQRARHLQLADHFDKGVSTLRHAEELPFQLRAAEAWDRLEALLTDLERFALLRARGDGELLGYWLSLKDRDPEALLCEAFDARAGDAARWTSADADLAFVLGEFLHFAGARGESVQRLSERCAAACERLLGAEHPDTLRNMNSLARTLGDRGDFAGAQDIQERVLEATTRVLGAEHPDTLLGMNNLAATLADRGDLAGAQNLQERVLEVQTRILGAEHPNTLVSMHNLAQTFYARGDLAGAQKLQERVLEAQTRLLGAEHPNTLASMSSLALTLSARGDLAGAQDLQERVLEATTRVLGAEHPDTLLGMNNLAATLADRGDLAGAQKLQERVLEARTRMLGAEHPDTVTSMGNLAKTVYARGDLAGAQKLQERVLEARTRLLGAEHPDTLRSMNNLAATLCARGDLAGAQNLQERVLEARTRLLGAEHPDTLTSMNNLTATLGDRGDLAGAQKLLERVLETQTRLLGAEHPNTLKSVNNLAGTLYRSGDLAGAQKLQERVLATWTRLLGAEHPDTLTSMSNLAATLADRGDLAGAQDLQERVLEATTRVLGAEHPYTLTSMDNLAGTLADRGDLAGAQKLQERVLEARTRVLGAEHPATLTSMNNLAVTLYGRGDLAGAQQLLERMLEAQTRLLGAEHPNTRTSAENLAVIRAAIKEQR
jgi:tetratricopeptide (TPR) repeat protein